MNVHLSLLILLLFLLLIPWIQMCTLYRCVCVCVCMCVSKLWRRKWQPTPVFLPGEPHGHKSLVCYSAWGYKELDTTLATEQVCVYILERGTQ